MYYDGSFGGGAASPRPSARLRQILPRRLDRPVRVNYLSRSSIGRRRQPKARERVGAPPARVTQQGPPWPKHGSQIPPTFLSPGPEYAKCHTAAAGGPSIAAYLARHGSVTKEEESLARLRTYSRTYERTSCLAPDVRADRWSPVGCTSSVARSPLHVGRSCTPHRERMDLPDRPAPAHVRYCRALAARVHTQRQCEIHGRNPIPAVTARRVDVHGQMS
jgi:hypothetical protein